MSSGLQRLTWGAALAAMGACTAPHVPALSHARAGEATAFIGVTVVSTGDGGTLLPDRTVIVRDGRIAAVAPRTSMALSPDTIITIDGTGRYLIAGLADMHVHLEHDRDPSILLRFVESGITTVRSMDGRPFILAWRDSVAQGTLRGPTIHTAGPILDGRPPARDDHVSVGDPAAAWLAVQEQHAAGYDFVKVYFGLAPDTHRAIVDAATRWGMGVAGHVPRRRGLLATIRSGQRTVEHLSDFAVTVEAADSPYRGRFHWSKLYLAMPSDSGAMQMVADSLRVHRVWTVPTLLERERSIAPPDSVARWLRLAEVAPLPEPWRDAWRERVTESARHVDQTGWQLLRDGRRTREQLVRVLHRTGAPLLIGTDTPNPFVVPGTSLHDELDRFHASGLTRADVLHIATAEAARFLGARDGTGTVSAGARADLLLLGGNPLDDLATLRRPLTVMVHGRMVVRVAGSTR